MHSVLIICEPCVYVHVRAIRWRRSMAESKRFMRCFFFLACVAFFTACGQNRGQPERPARGSVTFGADSVPVVWAQEDIEPFRRTFVRIAKKVIPSVVSVIPTIVDTVTFFRNPFYRFFGEPFGFNGEEPPIEKRERRVQGLGSGVIVSKSGYILTNYHVVAGAREIEIRLADDRIYPAEISGADSLSDIAVIHITGRIPDNLPVAYLGNSDSIETGAWVAAIGNPFSLMSTVTSGIISALGRQVGGQITIQNFIQTDAAINPGNSGGALVDLSGAVVGINTLIYSQTGGSMGIGFAIPINLAARVMKDLIYEGKVIRGWLGISVQEITPEVRQALGLETDQGALVADVFSGQPAAKAGIEQGDVIISLAGEDIEGANELLNAAASLQPGTTAPVTVIREGATRELTITVAERTPEVTEQAQRGQQQPRPQRGDVDNKIGIGVTALTRQLRDRLQAPSELRGVVVTQIGPGVTDQRARLQPGDIIMRAKAEGRDWKKLQKIQQFNAFVSALNSGESALLQVWRQGRVFFVPFEVP